jgi:thiol-disulfide isomerase/thioredoxin
MSRHALLFPLFLVLSGCGSRERPAAAPVVAGHAASELPWVVNDAPRAFAEAARAQKPVFVDVWATWCHTCVAMRSFVLNDPRVLAHANDAIWLALDADRPENASFLAEHPAPALPTFFLFDADVRAVSSPAANSPPREVWVGGLEAEDVLLLVGGGRGGDPRVAAQTKMQLGGDFAGCVKAADGDESHDRWGTLILRATALSCAGESATLAAQQGHLASETEAAILAALSRPEEEVRAHVDDLSSAYGALTEGTAGAERLRHAHAWCTFLEGRAAKATSAGERAVFDPHRLLAYLAAGTPERALPMLEQSRKDFPEDFNPPARLARALDALGRTDEALMAIDEALARVYGPRTLRIYETKAKILRARGDLGGEARALDAAIARAKEIRLTPGAQLTLDALVQRRATLPRL